jgi:hypothetical protein
MLKRFTAVSENAFLSAHQFDSLNIVLLSLNDYVVVINAETGKEMGHFHLNTDYVKTFPSDDPFYDDDLARSYQSF